MQELAERLTLHTRRGDMCSHAVNRQHQEGKDDSLPEFGDIKYVFYAVEQGLYHLRLSTGGLDFINSALAEFMRTDSKLYIEFSHTEHLDSGLHVLNQAVLQKRFRRYQVGT